ncbi:MAG: hypothetical protein HKN69_15715 [Desulfofustis sp.]|nr:hypothetical protein [Desulfofustis sp.]
MGGLSEKANSLKKIWRNTGGRVVVVDAGNPLFRKKGHYPPESDEFITAATIAEIYTLLNHDAVAVGANDLSGGLDLLRETENQGLPWVSANLYDNNGKPLFPPYISKTFDNLSIAIVGITGPSHSDSGDFIIKDGGEVLADLLPALDKVSDLIILLSAMPLEDTVGFIEQSPHIDLAIAADDTKGNIIPFLSGTTLVTQTGNRGRYQGVLSVHWNGSPLGMSTSKELLTLRKRFKTINLRLNRLKTNPSDANSKIEQIAQLEVQRLELIGQIENLEKGQKSWGDRNNVSIYEHRFVPLADTGRTDPQIDFIIKDTKKRLAAKRTQ